MTKPFIHLRCLSSYSLSESTLKIEKLVNLAKKNNMPALAITDNNNMFGVFEFAQECINNEAYKLLETFEIIDKKNMKPNKLSGGEQQRVAIARSLINKPNLILADEMTGNLDEKTSDEIINFFLKFVANHNISLIYVTHNKKYAEMAKIKYELRNKNLILK